MSTIDWFIKKLEIKKTLKNNILLRQATKYNIHIFRYSKLSIIYLGVFILKLSKIANHEFI
jgi:hypothetical protein